MSEQQRHVAAVAQGPVTITTESKQQEMHKII